MAARWAAGCSMDITVADSPKSSSEGVLGEGEGSTGGARARTGVTADRLWWKEQGRM